MKLLRFNLGRLIKLWALAPIFLIAASGFSLDPLSTWNDVFGGPSTVNAMAYGNGAFVGVGGGFRYISHDGLNWAAYASPPILNQAGIAFGNGTFLTFGTNAQNQTTIYQSTNGLNWSPIYTNANGLFAAAYGNNVWVFIGTNEILAATLNSPNWTWTEIQPTFSPAFVAFGNGLFALESNSGLVLSSPDGILWQFQSGISDAPNALAYGNGIFLTISFGIDTNNWTDSGFYSWTSSNLVQWTSHFFSDFGSNYWYPLNVTAFLTFGGGRFVFDGAAYNLYGYGNSGSSGMYSTLDGNNWSSEYPINPPQPLSFGQGAFIGSSGNTIYQSGVVTNAMNPPPSNLAISTFVGVTINGMAGLTYQIQFTTNLTSNWTTITNFALPYSPYLWIDTSTTVTGQRFYRSVQIQ